MKITSIRRAFTLVELLVVIAIIGVLMGLTLPAIQAVRASARQTTCLNNEKQIAAAAIAHDSTQGYLPYYRFFYREKNNTLQSVPVSWVVPLLPHLGETALWNQWENGTATYNKLSYLICPDTPDRKTLAAGLTYGANCGYSGTEADGGGVYAFQLGAFVRDPKTNKKSMISKMKDGASYTALASECLSITQWQAAERSANGILWSASATNSNFPSSNHPQKGFNMVFADGSGRYFNKSLKYLTYCQLMAPDDSKASKYQSNLNQAMDTKIFGK